MAMNKNVDQHPTTTVIESQENTGFSVVQGKETLADVQCRSIGNLKLMHCRQNLDWKRAPTRYSIMESYRSQDGEREVEESNVCTMCATALLAGVGKGNALVRYKNLHYVIELGQVAGPGRGPGTAGPGY
eukprot:766893-Hanusia_phi.AAC.1